MENVQHLRRQGHNRVIDGEVIPQRGADLAPQRSRREVSVPEPVSQSSRLYEEDKLYRKAKTVDSGKRLAEMSIEGIFELDERLQEARAEGKSPMALAGAERIQAIFGQGAGSLISDFINNPYERW